MSNLLGSRLGFGVHKELRSAVTHLWVPRRPLLVRTPRWRRNCSQNLQIEAMAGGGLGSVYGALGFRPWVAVGGACGCKNMKCVMHQLSTRTKFWRWRPIDNCRYAGLRGGNFKGKAWDSGFALCFLNSVRSSGPAMTVSVLEGSSPGTRRRI